MSGTFFNRSRIYGVTCSSCVSWKKQEYVRDDIKICLQEIVRSVDCIDRAQDGPLF